MKLIVGLGNPGEKYQNTRHNLGYLVINKIAKDLSIQLDNQTKLKCELAITMIGDETVLLATPSTYMNDSGIAIQKIKQFYKLENKDIWVVSDDLDLGFGTVRTRMGGSSGGHNGLKSIIEMIGSDFYRIRVGIKNTHLEKESSEKFVLKDFNREEQNQLSSLIDKTQEIILNCLNNPNSHDTISI